MRKLIPIFVIALIVVACLFLVPKSPVAAPPHPPLPAPPEKTATPATRPNVLLISIDTVRPDHLSCYGYAKKTTPNLEKWLEDSGDGGGVIFQNARSQAPWTLPSHMSLFTSMLPSHNGVDNINQVLSAEIPTLAQVLQENGYATAALVNNGQMKAHWGFNRGFEEWKEFEVDTPGSDCEHMTNEAMGWLERRSAKPQAAGEKPFLLFLHYYDAHDPYESPDEFKRAAGTTLSGDEARRIVDQYRSPSLNFDDAKLKKNLIAAYDAELMWLDQQLGRLLAKVPPNTMVVLFSDHGEAFEEHGWTLHGATLYDEEIRVVLMMQHVGTPLISGKGHRLINVPAMLLDVAPTILAACGIALPPSFQGVDLRPSMIGAPIKQRLIPSETKAVLEGRILRSVQLGNLKAIYSLFDGKFELYNLPDEQNDLAAKEPAAAKALLGHLRQWVGEEEYWLLHAHGRGDFDATLETTDGRFALFFPIGMDPERDSFEISEDGKRIRWVAYPGSANGEDGTKSFYFQLTNPAGAGVRLTLKHNGSPEPMKVFLGPKREHPASLPVETRPEASPPVIEAPFSAKEYGFYLERHAAPGGAASRPSRVESLDEQTIQQLRTLGYVR